MDVYIYIKIYIITFLLHVSVCCQQSLVRATRIFVVAIRCVPSRAKNTLTHHQYMFLIIQYFRKVAVHLQKMFEVMSTSVCTGLNPFNLISKPFQQICVRKVAVRL
jgi:hypothetical protein